jgi:hypothetical protein
MPVPTKRTVDSPIIQALSWWEIREELPLETPKNPSLSHYSDPPWRNSNKL